MPLSIAIVGAGMGGLAAAATLRARRLRRAGLRAGDPLRPHRRRHPDAAQLDEGAARHRPRGAAAPLRLRAALAPQPHLGHGRGDATSCRCPRALRRALPLHAPRRPARGARVGGADGARRAGQEAHRPEAARGQGDARLRRRHARRGRRGHRRRRPALDGARAPARPGDDRSSPAASPIARVFPASLDRARHRPVAHQVVGHRPPHRHLLHDRRPRRGLLRHQRAGAGRVADARSRGRRRAT